jgi:dihydroflavonol-4-reductase
MFTGFSVYNLARNNNFSCEKAKRELGFHTRPFSQTIADTIEWLRAEGKISATV